MSFVLRQISVYNYASDNKKCDGTVKIVHDSSGMEMQVKLNEQDVARIFEIFTDRIAVTMGMAAQSVLSEVMPVAQIASTPAAQIEQEKPLEGEVIPPPSTSASDNPNSDDPYIPF